MRYNQNMGNMGRYLSTMQTILLVLLFAFSNLFNLLAFTHLLVITGLAAVLCIWTALSSGKKVFSGPADPGKPAELKIAGPYRLIRRPGYLSLMLIGLAFFLSRMTFLTLGIFLLFAYTLETKGNYQEKLLEDKFPAYKKYQEKIPKYLPLSFKR